MEPNYGYKHTRGFIVFLIIIFCGWVIVAHSQVSNTGNLTGSTWTNGYSVPELACWGDERGSNNCSPGGIPYVRPSGAINFSYSFTELHQARAMADVLPYSGVGLMVTGFQFNWMSKNGNYWDDARQDQLSAYVQMYSKSGQWIESQSYNLNYIHDWTNFSWTGTFSKERRGEDLGTILYGFAGKDNNYWLGPYGPEIQNVSFSLRYQPDPCVVNPLHSTDCPGFLKAIASPAYQAQDASAPSLQTLTASTSSTSPALSLPTMTASVVKFNTNQSQLSQETESTASTSSTTNNNTVSSLTNQAAAPTSQARVRTTVDSTDSTSRDVAQGQVAVAVAATSTLVQNMATQTRTTSARDTTTKSDSTSDTATLDQSLIAMPQTTNTTTVATVSTVPIQPRSTAQTSSNDIDSSSPTQISLFRAPEPIIVNQPDTQTNYSLLEPARINTDPQPVSIPVQTLAAPSQPAAVVETVSVVEPVRAPTVEIPAVDGQSSTVAAALIDRTNPLNDAVNAQQLPTQTAVFAGPAVKPNTQDNDIAGGVSISQIARVPAGFDAYQNLAIREIAFYQPREIYRGQRTVDNVRALRSLGQDAKHQEMIDQQYRR